MPDPTDADCLPEIATAIADTVGAITGSSIPEPIKKNFFKAFSQLCTAAVEIPVAYMEGIAAEKRAETHARIKLIQKSANEIAQQMEFDPLYAQAAVKKFGQRVIREQINVDRITQKAALLLTSEQQQKAGEPAQEAEPGSISDDWLNVFEKEAGQKSTEEMQVMFAKILAGEVRKPSTFSIKAIRSLGSLDQGTANLFKKLCSMSMTLAVADHIADVRVPSLGSNAGSNGLQKYGLTFDALNRLAEYGLVISDYNSWMDYGFFVAGPIRATAVPIAIGRSKWLLANTEKLEKFDLKICGVALTSSGKELSRIVDCDADPKFLKDLSEWFAAQKILMIPVANPQTGPTAQS